MIKKISFILIIGLLSIFISGCGELEKPKIDVKVEDYEKKMLWPQSGPMPATAEEVIKLAELDIKEEKYTYAKKRLKLVLDDTVDSSIVDKCKKALEKIPANINYAAIYEEGVSLLNAKKYNEAKNKFLLVKQESTNQELFNKACSKLEAIYEVEIQERNKDINERNKEYAQQQKAAQESMGNFLADYNTVMSNQYKSLYSGCKLQLGQINHGTVYVYVTPLWYNLNTGMKENFITQATKWYFGMLGARNISFDNKHIDIVFRDQVTNAQVGKWGYIRGVVVNK